MTSLGRGHLAGVGTAVTASALTWGRGDFFISPTIWYHSQANVTREELGLQNRRSLSSRIQPWGTEAGAQGDKGLHRGLILLCKDSKNALFIFLLLADQSLMASAGKVAQAHWRNLQANLEADRMFPHLSTHWFHSHLILDFFYS